MSEVEDTSAIQSKDIYYDRSHSCMDDVVIYDTITCKVVRSLRKVMGTVAVAHFHEICSTTKSEGARLFANQNAQ